MVLRTDLPLSWAQGEEKANRNTCQFKNRCNSLKIHGITFSNRNTNPSSRIPLLSVAQQRILPGPLFAIHEPQAHPELAERAPRPSLLVTRPSPFRAR